MVVLLWHAQGLAGYCLAGTEKKSLCVREQRFPNTALALGWRLALITCVRVSFLSVIQHDSVRKQEQPLKHSGAFSLQCYRGWGWVGVGKECFTAALENISEETQNSPQKRSPQFTWQPLAAWPISSAMGGLGVPLHLPSQALHPTQSSSHCKCSSICQ